MTDRIESLDTLKGLAILAVVVIHLRGAFIGTELAGTIGDYVLLNLTRFGVPVFFLTSGFLLKTKLDEHEPVSYMRRYLYRLGYYYLIATVIYLTLQTALIILESMTGFTLPRDLGMSTEPLELLFNFFYTGYAVRMSLWFFPALIISASLLYLADQKGMLHAMVGLSVLLHAVGILTNAYGLLELPVPPRDALFFGLFYTAVGYKTATIPSERFEQYWKPLLGLVGVGIIGSLVERWFLTPVIDAQFFWYDYSVMTIPFAVGLFLFALSRPHIGKGSRLNTYGKYTLWGYVLHQVCGAALVGITLGIGMLTGTELLSNTYWNLLVTGSTFIITMEAVVWYETRGG